MQEPLIELSVPHWGLSDLLVKSSLSSAGLLNFIRTSLPTRPGSPPPPPLKNAGPPPPRRQSCKNAVSGFLGGPMVKIP